MFLLIAVLIVVFVLSHIIQYFMIKEIKKKFKSQFKEGGSFPIPMLIKVIPLMGFSFFIRGIFGGIYFCYEFIFQHKKYIERKQMMQTMMAMAKYEQKNMTKNRIRIPKGSNPQDNPFIKSFKEAGYNLDAPPPANVINQHH